MSVAADKGGSFGRIGKVWPRYGDALAELSHPAPAESSRDAPRGRPKVRRSPPGGPLAEWYVASEGSSLRVRWMLMVIAATLALFGTLAIGDGLYIKAKAGVAQVLLRTAWERARAGAVTPKPWPWADTYPVARLQVPAHGIDLLVLAGANGRTLAFGPGHHDGSALPGEDGNIVLSGHRDTHFRFLRELRLGEALELEARDGRVLRYRVRETQVTDFRKLVLPRWSRELTLVTCYPFDAITTGGPLRYVVTAVPDDSLPIR